MLSDATVVAASRELICVRLATYENEEEYDVLKELFNGRPVPNTAFLLLEPDGTPITRTMRGPQMMVERGGGPPGERGERGRRGVPRYEPTSGVEPEGAAELAAILTDTAKRFSSEKSITALPTSPDVRLALNVASCDSQPLVLIATSDEKERTKLQKALAELAWSDELVGRAQYVFAKADEDLSAIDGAKSGSIQVVRAGQFGLKGEVVAKAESSVSAKDLATFLAKSLDDWKPAGPKDSRTHVRAGKGEGAGWETAVPISDPNVPENRDRSPDSRGRSRERR